MHHLTPFSAREGVPARRPLGDNKHGAAAVAALSPCLLPISRCVFGPLNSSRGKPIKVGVRNRTQLTGVRVQRVSTTGELTCRFYTTI